jgi:hypothetical protein
MISEPKKVHMLVQGYNKINGVIKRNFGIQMSVDTKLHLHNIPSKATLNYGSEDCI